MSDSSPASSDAMLNVMGDPRILLSSYMRDSKISSKAYELSEGYYRWLHKALNYPLVVLIAVNTVCAAIKLNEYVIMGISLAMLILKGFDSFINPKEKEHLANQVNVEFGEISRNIKQHLLTTSSADDEASLHYSETVHELINVWTSLSPPCRDDFVLKSKKIYAERSRSHSMKKKVPRLKSARLST